MADGDGVGQVFVDSAKSSEQEGWGGLRRKDLVSQSYPLTIPS